MKLFKFFIYLTLLLTDDQCTDPDMPPNANELKCVPDKYEIYNYKQCALSCNDGYAQSIPGPVITTCDPNGNWNPEQRFTPYRITPCGSKYFRRHSILQYFIIYCNDFKSLTISFKLQDMYLIWKYLNMLRCTIKI